MHDPLSSTAKLFVRRSTLGGSSDADIRPLFSAKPLMHVTVRPNQMATPQLPDSGSAMAKTARCCAGMTYGTRGMFVSFIAASFMRIQ